MDGELHNDLLLLIDRNRQDPLKSKLNVYKNDLRENMTNLTTKLLDLIKSAGEEQLTDVGSTMSKLLELAQKHEEIQADLAKLSKERANKPVSSLNANGAKKPSEPEAAPSSSSCVSAAVNLHSSSTISKHPFDSSKQTCECREKASQILSMITSLDSDFKMAHEVKYVGSFFAWGISSVYGDREKVWRRDPLRTCCCCNCSLECVTVLFWTFANFIRWLLTIILLFVLFCFLCGGLFFLIIITVIIIFLRTVFLIPHLLVYYIFCCCWKKTECIEPFCQYWLFLKELFRNVKCTLKELQHI